MYEREGKLISRAALAEESNDNRDGPWGEFDLLGVEGSGVDLAKGAGAPVLVSARRFIEQRGRDALSTVAKLHFKTTQQILD